MTNEEALKGFADYCKECRTNAQTLGADVVCGVCKVFVAKQAIEMQIPQKLTPLAHFTIFAKCSLCGETIRLKNGFDHCPWCGKAIEKEKKDDGHDE